MKDNPYVGPRAFQKEDKYFYGRRREARDLFWLILAERVVLFYAQSGAGKTSLLNARVIPDLEKRGFDLLPVVRVASDPPPGIARSEVPNLFVFSALMGLAGEHAPARDLLAHTLLSYLAHIRPGAGAGGAGAPPVLVLDQFEEVFTAHRDRWGDIQGFFAQIGEALKELPRLSIILALREDYVAGLDPYAAYFPKGLQARFRMERLGREGAIEAVRKPAKEAGCPFGENVAEWLVDNLSRVKVPIYEPEAPPEPEAGARPEPPPGQPGLLGEDPGSVLGPYVEAVQLQVVCQRIWEELKKGTAQIQFRDVGDVDKALTGFYESVVQEAAGETGVGEREIRRWFDRKLITPQGTRNLVLQGKEDTGGLPNAVVDVLRSRYLVGADVRAGGRWFELCHDRLIEPIRESNTAWREARLQPFQRQAERWDSEGRPARLLLDARALEQAEGWAAHHDDELIDEERAFLAASREAHSRTQAQARQAEVRTNLAETGWAVIFAAGDPLAEARRLALAELLDHRRSQATEKNEKYYQELSYLSSDGRRPPETAQEFLARHGVGAGIAPPDKMPYYLLIVGDPEWIPFEFQYDLDVQYAAGRLHFERLEEYAQYARSVVTAERGAFSLPPQAAIFGPQNPANRAMRTVMDDLVRPVAGRLPLRQPDWTLEPALSGEATKARLGQLLGGTGTPTLLFSATYGLGLPGGHPRQVAEQGALLCQEWPGEDEPHEEIPRDSYFTAEDVAEDARLLGLVAFLLTNYSAGTPRLDDFAHQSFQEPQPIAPRAFVARLPQRLLGHPKGGALAVIGHVERAWTTSFVSEGGRIAESGLFESVLGRLMQGHTVGSAMELFDQRYAQLSSRLAEELQQVVFYDRERDRAKLAGLMTQVVDARNYVILGDPAARLPVGSGVRVAERPAIEPVTLGQEAVAAWKQAAEVSAPATPRPPAPELEAKGGPAPGDLLVFSGINGATGEYLLSPMTLHELSAIIQGRP